MDEYGIFRNNRESVQKIREALNECGNILFTYSFDGNGTMIILINNRFRQMGTISSGGNPRGRCFVSISGYGSAHLSSRDTHPQYIMEKLHLSEYDAKGFAELWEKINQNVQKIDYKFDYEQEGFVDSEEEELDSDEE